jgi:hypothetical protein
MGIRFGSQGDEVSDPEVPFMACTISESLKNLNP